MTWAVRIGLGVAAAGSAVVLAACGATGGSGESTGVIDTGAGPVAVTTGDVEPKRAKRFVVARVVDGDTIELRNGKRVRLVQIDAPEEADECFGEDATAILSAILPKGTKVTLATDPALDRVDEHDRLLRYVFKGEKNVNLTLVQRGAASVWFVGDKGRYAKQLQKAARNAKAGGRGLWGACPGTKFDPSRAVQTGTGATGTGTSTETSEPEPAPTEEETPAPNCHPSYEGACLDPSASDYDCQGGSGNGPLYTGPVRVVGPDDYDLDRDGDGYACE